MDVGLLAVIWLIELVWVLLGIITLTIRHLRMTKIIVLTLAISLIRHIHRLILIRSIILTILIKCTQSRIYRIIVKFTLWRVHIRLWWSSLDIYWLLLFLWYFLRSHLRFSYVLLVHNFTKIFRSRLLLKISHSLLVYQWWLINIFDLIYRICGLLNSFV